MLKVTFGENKGERARAREKRTGKGVRKGTGKGTGKGKCSSGQAGGTGMGVQDECPLVRALSSVARSNNKDRDSDDDHNDDNFHHAFPLALCIFNQEPLKLPIPCFCL